jgi:hypothetical protein
MKEDREYTSDRPGCPACAAGRCHTEEETRAHHPLARHGFTDGKWTDPAAKLAHDAEVEAREKGSKLIR